MFHLHHLQASFNSKVTETKEAADLLAKYTKKATSSFSVNNVAIVDAIVTAFAPVVHHTPYTIHHKCNTVPRQALTVTTKHIEFIESNSLERNTNHDEEQALDCVSFVSD